MNKKDREIVFNKYGGKCAYCGYELKRNWHCDHLEPVNRTQKIKEGYYQHKVTGSKISPQEYNTDNSILPDGWWKEYVFVNRKLVFDKMLNPERDTVENSMPSCHSCNITKSSMSLQDFREYIEQTVESLNKNRYAAYKFAKRYGLIQETVKPVLFYFETLNKQP